MKKVLHVLYSMDSGGIEQFLLNLIRHNYRSSNKIKMDFMLWKQENKMSDEISKYESIINLITSPQKNLIRFIIETYRIFKMYDIVHLHSDYFNGFLSVLAKLTNVKVVVSHSHTTNDGKENSLLRKVYRMISRKLILKNSDELIGCSKQANIHLYGEKNKETIVVNNGVELKNFLDEENGHLKEELNIDNNNFVLGHIGRFSFEKNHIQLLRIFYEMKKVRPDINLVLVGDGPLRSEIVKYINDHKLSDSVFLIGIRKDIPNILNSIDMFILPSLFEGMPLTVIEAQASGKNVVISKNIPDDVIILNELILKINLEDPDKELAHQILQWVNHEVSVSKNNIYERMKEFNIEEVYIYLLRNIYRI